MDDKIDAAFSLYDVARGTVSFDELRLYLLSIYRVLQACSNDLALKMQSKGGPVDLAHDTAERCFLTSGLDKTAKIDAATFKEFVLAGMHRPYDL